MSDRAVVVDDEENDELTIDIPTIKIDRGETGEYDPFSEDVSQIKKLGGVSSNQKRKINTMEKRLEGEKGGQSKALDDQAITGYNAFEVISPPYNLDYLAKLYEISPPHKSAVDAKTSNIVGLGYDFTETNKIKRKIDDATDKDTLDKLRKKVSRAKDDMEDWIDGLNKEDAFSETLAKVWKDYETTGNGYIEIGRITTGPDEGAIGYVGHVPATSVRVRRNRDGFVQIIGKEAVFFRNFGAQDPNPVGNDNAPNELIHLKKYSPASGTYYGVPDIVAAKQAIAGNEFSARFNLDYFENKAIPRHLIIVKGATLGGNSLKNLIEFFETGLKGEKGNHRSLVVPLPPDRNDRKVEFKIEPIEADVQDSSFNNYRNANLAEILMSHRVPITKIGTPPSGINLAAARDMDKTFKEQVCQPEQRIIEKKLNRVIKEYTDMFLIKLNELTLTDENTQSQIDERRRKTGVETANEQRSRRGQPGVEGGDELFDLNGQAKKAAASAQPAPTGSRQRDSVRSANQTDNVGEARNPKGEGRTTP